MLALAAAVESRSEHPLAQAILTETQARQLSHLYPAARDVTALVGKGVRGYVNGDLLTVSSHTHGHDELNESDVLHQHIEAAETNGQTVILVSKGEDVLGFISVADTPRLLSAQAVRDLKHIVPQARVIMLTGDNPTVAANIAAEIGGVDEVRAELLPEDKVMIVEGLRAHGLVAMIGDGVNDAPALAASAVGIAMGGAGTAQAMETADVVLMQDDLTHLPDLVQTSRRARQIIIQNIAFSLGIKALFLILTLPGLATLWMAVFADMGASLLVTLNGMRMLRQRR
jgi:Cd2+/Zn2+-exporting ATPase